MANPLGIVHPALKERMQMMFYPSFCTIEQVTETQDSFGAVTVTWSTLADHAELRCRLAPSTSASPVTSAPSTAIRPRTSPRCAASAW